MFKLFRVIYIEVVVMVKSNFERTGHHCYLPTDDDDDD